MHEDTTIHDLTKQYFQEFSQITLQDEDLEDVESKLVDFFELLLSWEQVEGGD
ncbi:hypothetical protein HDR58_00665 [bacterium]|nr:hypothetical protein [bacterium]